MKLTVPVLEVICGDYDEGNNGYINIERTLYLKNGIYPNFPANMITKRPVKKIVEIPDEILSNYLTEDLPY